MLPVRYLITMEATDNLIPFFERYYDTARQWKSDLAFFKTEIAFFHQLVDDYFLSLLETGHLSELREAVDKLDQFEHEENRLQEQLDNLLKTFALIAEGQGGLLSNQLTVAYMDLSASITKVYADFHNAKKELFHTVEKVMTDRKLLNP